MQPDGILKAFKYADSFDDFKGQIKRRKSDGMRDRNLGV